jgi:hypothetical protein
MDAVLKALNELGLWIVHFRNDEVLMEQFGN